MSQPISTPITLTEQAAAALIGIEVKTLRNLRSLGEGPVFVRLSRKTVVYLPADIEAYLLARRQAPGGRPAPALPSQAAPVPAEQPPEKRGRGRPRTVPVAA